MNKKPDTTPPDNRLILPIDDTCIRLGGIGRSTVYELINTGQLVKVKIGSRGFVTAASIAAYVDRITAAATAS